MVDSSRRPNESRAVGFLRGLCSTIASLALLAACATPGSIGPAPPGAPARDVSGHSAGRGAEIYLVRRSWHIDIGFAASELGDSLAPLRAALPEERYILVGFGDRQYLLGRGNRVLEAIGALFPGAAVLLITGLEQTPRAVFGARDIVSITITRAEERKLERFIGDSLARSASGAVKPLASGGDYAQLLFASPERYSGLHTCNTWAAEALEAAGLPVSSKGVEFAFQLWSQARRLEPRPNER